MPIPLLYALQVEQEKMLGGSTMPSLMLVGDEKGSPIGHYVVKIFKPRNVQQYQPTNKEVYCHILAKEFGLLVPDAALVYVDEEIIKRLPVHEDVLLTGYYFGTIYMPDTMLVQAGISEQEVEDAALIFAFDVLIRNMDRTISKPNLLLHDGNAMLIDHELALDIHKSFNEYWALGGWNILVNKGKQQHVLFSHLQTVHRQKPLKFEEFSEYLHRMNLTSLHQANELLVSTNNRSEQFQSIISYLQEIKQQPSKFIDLLQHLLR